METGGGLETMKRDGGKDLYLDGEERFGIFSSRLYSFFSGLHTWKLYRQILEVMGEYNPKSVLDVGCGPGYLLLEIARKWSGIALNGIDPSPYMVKIARRKVERKGLSERISITEGSSRMPGTDGKFGMIISSFSFHHWEGKEESLEILLSHLETDGILIIFEMNPSGLYGKIPVVRKHALDLDAAGNLEFEGFEKSLHQSADSGLAVLSFRRIVPDR